MKPCVNRKIQVLQRFETYELKEFQSSVSVTKSCKNFSTNIGVRNLQDFHVTKSLGARNLQDFHLARKVPQETCKIFILQEVVQETCKIFILQKLVQETCKIFILQDIWCKKRARFLTCKISSARNLHILQETCKMVQDFFTWAASKPASWPALKLADLLDRLQNRPT